MSKLINWIKTKPIIAASLLLVFIAVGILGYVIPVGCAFTDTAKSHLGKQVKEINKYLNTPVKIPSTQGVGSPREKGMVVTDEVIKSIRSIFGEFKTQHESVKAYMVGRNAAGHLLMAENMFNDDKVLTKAPDLMRHSVWSLLDPRIKPAAGTPPVSLHAGMPPSDEEINKAVQNATDGFYKELRLKSGAELTDGQRKKLDSRKGAAIQKALALQAERLHIYAAPVNSAKSPLGIPAWVDANTAPTAAIVFPSQIDYWVMQDMISVIGLTNGLANIDEKTNAIKMVNNTNVNVINGGVKRLIQVRVFPGFVGLAAPPVVASVGGQMNRASGVDGYDPDAGPSIGVGRPVSGTGQVPPSPPVAAPPGAAARPGADTSNQASEDFTVSPSGRISKKGEAIYDVKHVVLSVIVRYDAVPELLRNITRVNFMTVLKFNITDVDEYGELKQGYYYGHDDCVRLDVLVESLWFRDFIVKYMPEAVKQDLGLAAAAQDKSGFHR